ncbi:MAG: Spy/CpxP family protein refolding chaperone [Candidatus Sulfotelmatobacter sp.]
MRVFKNRALLSFLMFGVLAASAGAQQAPPAPREEGPPPAFGDRPRGHDRGMDGPGRSAIHVGPPGRWWDDPAFAGKIGITADQKKKMDEIFTANRLKLIDLVATVQKEEVIMEPLVEADPPDEAKVLAQIDKVAQARAELEKANTRMLFDLRRQLNHEQWIKLQAERPPDRGPGRRHRGPEDGPGKPPGL